MVLCRLADKYQQPSSTLIPQKMKAQGLSNLFLSISSDGITSQKKTILTFIVIRTSNIIHAVNQKPFYQQLQKKLNIELHTA
jgi:hypothetical protein